MKIYPFNSPIILNTARFSEYGGQGTGTFSSAILQNAFLMAEMQATEYIGAPLLPVTITGTYPFQHQWRLATDYGYVQQIHNVTILTKKEYNSCDLQENDGCAYVYDDTFGYVDFKCLALTQCNCSWWGYPYSPYVMNYQPYQIRVSYTAGLPTGTATQPGIMRALTILAQSSLNDMFPGTVGNNESMGGVGIQSFSALDYSEQRAQHALIKTALGDDAMSQRARKLIDMSVKKARRVLLV